MNARHKRTFAIGILAVSLWSPVAFADPAADLARAYDFYEKQQMVDAMEITKKLAEQNYLPAQAFLGEILDYTEANEDAVGWFIMSASQGDAAGAYGLGRMYLSGKGIKKDPGQALYWIKFAAEKDNINAVKSMEEAYRKGAPSGLPVSVDLKQAQFWEAKRIPLEAAIQKAEHEKQQAALKAVYEKQQARKKADDEAAEKERKGKTK